MEGLEFSKRKEQPIAIALVSGVLENLPVGSFDTSCNDFCETKGENTYIMSINK